MITAIILGAGFSSRFGSNKLLSEINQKPIIELVLDKILEIDFEEVILVYKDEEIKKITEKKNVKSVKNLNSKEGMSSSVKLGIMNSSQTDAYMFFNGDQPFIDKETINLLMNGFYENKGSIIVPRFNGKKGTPVIFSAKWTKALLDISGDVGGRNIIKDNLDEVYFVDISNNKAGIDIDTWDDYQKIIQES